ncbi:MAG: hypothetical protein KC486_36490, partial [Myxococcales bacterium]|nr:hypothetical protein [Myxococcales bacterium]
MVAAVVGGGGCSGDDGTASATDGTSTATTGTSASSATEGTSATTTEGTSATNSTGTSSGTSGPTTTATGGETTGEETTGGETTGGPVDPPPTVCEALPLVDTGGATVVGDGTPGSCTEAALASAVAGGGAVVFDCGDAPHTITLSAAIAVTADVVIDGDDRITLAGAGADRLLEIETGNFEALTPHLTVQRLHFTGGRASGTAIPLGTDVDGGGGAIYLHGGSLTVLDSSFTGNACALEGPDVGGGAIYGVGAGSITVSGSSFNANQGANGGAIGALGMDLTVINSTLVDNEATGFGANYVENNQQMGRGGNGGAI